MQSIDFLYKSFWNAVTKNAFSSPNFTDCLNLLSAVEITIGNKEVRKRIDWLHKHTCEELHQPIATIEFMIFKNWKKGTMAELEIGGSTYTLTQLFQYCNNLLTECCELMTVMTKNYSFDIKYSDSGANQDSGVEESIFSLGKKKDGQG